MHIIQTGPVEPDQLLSGHGGQPVAQLTYGLVEQGHHVTVVTLDPSVATVQLITGKGFDLIKVPARLNPRHRLLDFYRRERKALVEVLRNIPFDVLHSHWTYEYALAAIKVSPNAIVTSHDDPLGLFNLNPSPGLFFRRIMARKVARRKPFSVAVSPYIGSQWAKLSGVADVQVIPNIVAGPTTKRPNGIKKAPVAIAVGHSHPNKNLIAALEAWKLVHEKIPEAELYCFGHGLSPGCELERAVDATKYNIHFAGPVAHDELLKFMQGADFLIHPSLSEGCSMAILEGLTCGLPVIYNKGVLANEWVSGKAGLACNFADAAVAADAIVSLMHSDSKLSDLRYLALIEAERFNSKSISVEWESYYRSIMALKG